MSERELEAAEREIARLEASAEKWRSDFVATERTAQKLDKEWERLSDILGVDREDETILWPQLVDGVKELRDALHRCAVIAGGDDATNDPYGALQSMASIAWKALGQSDAAVATGDANG